MLEKAYELEAIADGRGWIHLDFLTGLPNQKVQVSLVITPCSERASSEAAKAWTLEELLSLPLEQRNVVLEDIIAKADTIYRTNPELHEFEAAEFYESDETDKG